MASVYSHTREDTNEIFYIGIELDSNTKYKNRPYKVEGRSLFWKNIAAKTSYTVDIIYDNLTNVVAKEMEIFLILLYGRRDLNKGSLVNLTNGGDGAVGKITSKETKLKLSKALIGKNKGVNNPMYGKNPYEDNPHPKSRIIIDKLTKIEYPSINKAAKVNNISKTTLLRWLKTPSLNKSNLDYK